MEVWEVEVGDQINRVDLAVQKLMAEGSPARRDEALQVTQALCALLRGLKLDKPAVERASVRKGEGQEIRPEDVLKREQVDLLARARDGELPCPRCERPLHGKFVFVEVDEEDFYAGVKLSCWCGFVEY